MLRTWLSHCGRQQDNNKKLIDFRGYPSPQFELEYNWQVGAKVDQYRLGRRNIDITSKEEDEEGGQIRTSSEITQNVGWLCRLSEVNR